MDKCPNEITIDGTVYTKKVETPSGKRGIYVVDRGWIFVGDLVESP